MITKGKLAAKNLANVTEANQGLLVIFDEVYDDVTDTIINKINEGEFENPEGLVEVIIEFDNHYRRAKQAYFNPQCTPPPVWDKVFRLLGAGEPASRYAWSVSVLEALTLPMIVHMVHDLPLAVATNLITQPRELQANLRDYDRINNLLWAGLYDVQQRVLAKYSPALIILSEICGDTDEFILYQLIKLLRGTTWYDAIRLFDTRKEELDLGYELKSLLKTGLDKSDEQVQSYDRQLTQLSEKYRDIRKSIEDRTNDYLDFLIKPPWFFPVFKVIFLTLRICDGVFLTLIDLIDGWIEPAQAADASPSEFAF